MSGVTATGFEVKTLETIRNEINAALVAAIGSGFDVSLDTPQGQISAVIADAHSSLWELGQDIYASFDIRQATGARLDQLGALRYQQRKTGETDQAYRTRLLAPRNATNVAVDNLIAAISAVDGVTDVQVHYNATGIVSRRGQQSLTASIVVRGGNDADVSRAIVDNLVFGLGLTGNTTQNVDDNGVCRTIRYVRPEVVTVKIDVTTREQTSIGACGATSITNIQNTLLETFETTYSTPQPTLSLEYLRARLLTQGTGIASLAVTIEDQAGTVLGTTDDPQGVIVLDTTQVVELEKQNINVTIGV